tara:strand:- start:56 stop:298 length:243 start_codon:yes stop_codon:yes gene_type:complete
MKREKLFKSQDFKAKQRKRIQEQEAAAQAAAPAEDTWGHYSLGARPLHEQLDEMLGAVPQEQERIDLHFERELQERREYE